MKRLLAVLLLVAAACSDGSEPRAASTTTTTERRTTTTEADEPDDTTSTTRRTRTTQPDARLLQPAFPPVIGGLGDSLLAGAEPDIKAQLDDTTYTGEGQQGQKIQTSSYRLDQIIDARPAGTAVVLGTNNAMDGPDAEDVSAARELMSEMSRLPCVRWVEVTTSTGSEIFNRAARAINAEIHREADTYTNIDVVPWADVIALHPEWVGYDGIHHTPAGAKALADAILDSLAECPATLMRR